MNDLIFPAKVLDQHVVVLGKTGSGKSSALRYMVEYLLAQKKRVVVVDPKGDWHGLKVASDGRHPGFPVIAFGNFKDERATDVPINPHSGKQVAELIATGNRPAIVGFRGWKQGEMTRFWIDFASTVFKLNKGDLYLVIDEVHNFAPKGKIMSVDAGECLHWTNRIINEGRGLGITALLASQRPQKVHNDTLTACETLVAMRVIHEADRAALREWIDGCGDKAQGKTVLDNVASMPRGDAFVWSPEINFGPVRLHFPMFQTFDSFQPPQLQKAISESGWGDVDIEDVKQKLAAVIEESKQNDPRELKKTIAELRKEIARMSDHASKPVPAEATIETKIKEVPVLKDGQLKRAEALVEKIAKQFEAMRQSMAMADAAYIGLTETIARVNAPAARGPSGRSLGAPSGQNGNTSLATPTFVVHKPQAMGPSFLAKSDMTKTFPPGHGQGLSNPEQRIVNAIAWMESLGIAMPQKTAVAFLADYTYGSGGFNNPCGSLRSKGLVEYLSGNLICLTEEGRAVASYPAEMLTPQELQRHVLARLPNPEQKILTVLLEEYPNAISKEACANRAGYTPESGGFNNPCGRLRRLGLSAYPKPGFVCATDLLFLR